jgi:hypothetical protein
VNLHNVGRYFLKFQLFFRWRERERERERARERERERESERELFCFHLEVLRYHLDRMELISKNKIVWATP